jgi:hypothetical protein
MFAKNTNKNKPAHGGKIRCHGFTPEPVKEWTRKLQKSSLRFWRAPEYISTSDNVIFLVCD